jgi:hypothetical protein
MYQSMQEGNPGARLGGFPADRALEVATIMDPTTAEPDELTLAAKV